MPILRNQDMKHLNKNYLKGLAKKAYREAFPNSKK
ncbi:hypothetical protein M2093_001521 [Breznakia sp. PH1-1]|nr:hypothetical protein [Breznakia sp. PH1-1]MDH6404485.1 hypothetical protein [Breznakia sp. PF1-11]MDH6412194.1 hypothetical protein [Breznakia sp. PFB1-11]MDH6414534.1 hypothetical protein [Breznakia sp. PFB1-14]MDH6416858.1 hypothetical protein [Breznakia sp. PFB1-4]MDH6419288.1 hypothetical protein [Breznakia sp. PFB1-12]MDH6474146.1 hypothetical protein [Breznakia sp. PFB2-30]MDH6476659.1 hypothetical protein [Breznakia sp. PFB1-19]